MVRPTIFLLQARCRCIACAACVFLYPAFGADSVDLNVRGEIVPTACTPLLSTTEVNLGQLVAGDLSETTETELPARPITLTLTCDAAAVIGWLAIDNRAGTSASAARDAYGLGLSPSGAKIGEVILRSKDASADGAATQHIIRSVDGGDTWERNALGRTFEHSIIFAIDVDDNAEPEPHEVQSFSFDLSPKIAPTEDLRIVDAIAIDGSITIEIFYF